MRLNNLYQGKHYFNDGTGGSYIAYNYDTSRIGIYNTNNNVDIHTESPVRIIMNNDVNVINRYKSKLSKLIINDSYKELIDRLGIGKFL